jgi:hypothetical protein
VQHEGDIGLIRMLESVVSACRRLDCEQAGGIVGRPIELDDRNSESTRNVARGIVGQARDHQGSCGKI